MVFGYSLNKKFNEGSSEIFYNLIRLFLISVSFRTFLYLNSNEIFKIFLIERTRPFIKYSAVFYFISRTLLILVFRINSRLASLGYSTVLNFVNKFPVVCRKMWIENQRLNRQTSVELELFIYRNRVYITVIMEVHSKKFYNYLFVSLLNLFHRSRVIR